jgi:hypothetical protein
VYLNQDSGGCPAFQAGAEISLVTLDVVTQQVKKATGENAVTITRSFTEYLR